MIVVCASVTNLAATPDEQELEGVGSQWEGLTVVKDQLFCLIDAERSELVKVSADLSMLVGIDEHSIESDPGLRSGIIA